MTACITGAIALVTVVLNALGMLPLLRKRLEPVLGELSSALEIITQLGVVKNYSNSNLSTGIDIDKPKKPRKKGKRNPGAVKGHKGTTHEQDPNPDDIVLLKLENEEEFEADPDWEKLPPEIRQVKELRFEINTTNFEASRYQNIQTGKVVTAKFPPEVKAPFQFGLNVKALVLFCRIFLGLPYEKITDFLDFFDNFTMSKGTAANIVARGSKSPGLINFKQGALRFLAQSPVCHFDETLSSVAREPAWVHFAGNQQCSLTHVDKSRGLRATLAGGVMQNFHGTAVHDRWAAYRNEAFDCDHAYCGAHIVRELEGLSETGSEYAKKMKALLLLLNNIVKENGGTLPKEKKDWANKRYKTIVNQGYTETGGKDLPKMSGKRGKPKKTPARNLLEFLDKFKDDMLRFTYEELVPFTNNFAEISQRGFKNHLKISGTFKTMKTAQGFVDLSMYIDTCRHNGISSKNAVKDLFAGKTEDFIMKWMELPPVTKFEQGA